MARGISTSVCIKGVAPVPNKLRSQRNETNRQRHVHSPLYKTTLAPAMKLAKALKPPAGKLVSALTRTPPRVQGIERGRVKDPLVQGSAIL